MLPASSSCLLMPIVCGSLFCVVNRSKSRYDVFQKVNNDDADQSARMHSLVCAFDVRKSRRQVLSRRGVFYFDKIMYHNRVTNYLAGEERAGYFTLIVLWLSRFCVSSTRYRGLVCSV